MALFPVTDKRRSHQIAAQTEPLPVSDVDIEVHEATMTVQSFWAWANLCHCGRPQVVLRQIAEALEHVAKPATDRARVPDTLEWYVLDAWELTEHGTSSAFPWLTPNGRRLLDAIRLVDVDQVLGDKSWEDVERRRWPGRTLTLPAWEEE